MNNRRTLSIAPYYGGKEKMAHFIADRFDYSNTELFITPFGGMCRELLNKPRHKIECYNDYNSALCALMRVLSNPEDADTLIHRLYEETEFDEEIFYEQKAIYDSIEKNMEEQESQKIRKFLIDNKFATPYTASKLLNEIGEYFFARNSGNIVNASDELVKLQTAIEADAEFKKNFQKLIDNWYLLYEHRKLHESDGDTSIYFSRPAEMGVEVDDIDLAIATLVVFMQSWNGMGKAWGKDKFKNSKQYKDRILRLYDCAERLEGISVYNIDALDFFRRWEQGENSGTLSCVMNGWIADPKVMMYCDPSYISVESEKKLLKEIDISKVDFVSSAIRQQYGGKMPHNLGKVYSRSFGYEDQELFLICAQQAKCKMMISNYDLQLYNKYLNPATGWRREEFLTTTSIIDKPGNARTEVIWYNY